jgi:hypothetical protein
MFAVGANLRRDCRTAWSALLDVLLPRGFAVAEAVDDPKRRFAERLWCIAE